MPTGYTADLYDGKDVTFREFVLRCARAMSPFIMQRDNDPNEAPKKVDDSYSYYRKRLPEIVAERDEFLSLDRTSRKRLWTEYVKRTEWESHTLDRNAGTVDYYIEEVRKEDERVAFQHEYTDKLYAALGEADPAATGVTTGSA